MSVLWPNLGLERWVVAGSCRIPYVRLNVAGKVIQSALGKGSSFVSVSRLTLLCLCSHLCLPPVSSSLCPHLSYVQTRAALG